MAARLCLAMTSVLTSIFSLPLSAQGALSLKKENISEACRADFGSPVNVDACGKVTLPTLLIESQGISRHKLSRDSAAYQCRDYRATDQKEHSAKFKQCSYGVLGGTETFRVGGKAYTVFYDINRVDHIFYQGALTDAQIDQEMDSLQRKGMELPFPRADISKYARGRNLKWP